MKNVLIGVIVVVIIAAIGFLTIGKAPEDVERASINEAQETNTNQQATTTSAFNGDLQKAIEDFDLANLNFKFTGYGPGKSHEGTFTAISISNIEHNNDHITKGTVKFVVSSVATDSKKLDADLCFENFFNCPTYPEISFTLTDVSRVSATELKAAGNLTMKGITKQVSFPVMQNSNQFTTDFILDVNQFGFSAPSIVDNEVRIQFDATL